MMFKQVATSCNDMLLSGSARRYLASTVSAPLVLGSLNTLTSLAAAPMRRLLSMSEEFKLGISTIISASRIQVHAIDADIDELYVREQRPMAVLGIRRRLMISRQQNVLIIPKSSFLNVSVSVKMGIDLPSTKDVGITVLVLTISPFSTSIPAALISPVVYVSTFNAKSSTELFQEPYVVHAEFPVSLNDHKSRKMSKSDGSDMVER